MSTICICGVCVPCSAVWPVLLLLLALKWLVDNMLPVAWRAQMQQWFKTKKTTKNTDSCWAIPQKQQERRGKTTLERSSAAAATQRTITSPNHFDELLNSHEVVVIKWTASWCQPCQRIQPTFAELAERVYDTTVAFGVADVDQVETLAAEFNVAIMLPTFTVHTKRAGRPSVVDTYRGSDEAQLRTFVQRNTI